MKVIEFVIVYELLGRSMNSIQLLRMFFHRPVVVFFSGGWGHVLHLAVQDFLHFLQDVALFLGLMGMDSVYRVCRCVLRRCIIPNTWLIGY